jgi:protein ImuB
MRAPSSRKRYLSVWLRRLTTDRLIRANSPAWADTTHVGGNRSAHDEALVVAEPVKGALRLAAVNDAADGLGLRPGMALADARAMYPRIAIADADPDADRRLLIAIADWCDRYTPLVGLDPPDGLLLDISGCAHLFGGEEAMRRDIIMRLAQQGFQARAAVADTVGCAWAVARYGTELRILSEQTRDALLPLPLAALRIAPETVTALAQVGLKHIADVIDRPRAPLAARFRADFVRRIDQAMGYEDEPITPRLPVLAYVTERRFADPIALEADVLGTIEHLAHELVKLMERRGEGARLIEAALFRTDGKVYRIAAGTGAPLRDAARIRALFVERLAAIGDECDPGFGYDVVRLGALTTDRCDSVQTGLVAPDHAAELAHLVDRLGARFGLRRVTRLVPQDTHIPEFAVAGVAAAAVVSSLPSPLWGGSRTKCAGWGSRGTQRRRDILYPPPHPSPTRGEGGRDRALLTPTLIPEQDSLSPTRPIRLFERPEPIEAIATVPDGPPVQFTWRRVRYTVAHAEGPERIAMEWWRNGEGNALTRDYFRVESREGVRVWLYRQGLFDEHSFNDGFFTERSPPSWFLHGVFA